MENEFASVMAKHSDSDLVTIVTIDRHKYQPLAIEAAEAEIDSRGISAEKIDNSRQRAFEMDRNAYDFELQQVPSTLRFVHFVVDSIAVIVIYMVALVAFSFVGAFSDPESLAPVILFVFIFLGYYICMESATQQTIGKMITATKVMTSDNREPTTADIVARSFCRLIPFDRLSFLFVRNGFHDSISRTTVVRNSP